MAINPAYVASPIVGVQNFVQGVDSAATYKTLYTGGASGSKVVAVTATSTSTNTHLITLAITRSSVNYTLGSYLLPVNTGVLGNNASADILGGGPSNYIIGLPVDNDGQKYIYLQSGDTLRATFTNSLSTSAKIDIVSFGADF